MEKGKGWVRDQCEECFTELGKGGDFQKLKNSASTENKQKNMILNGGTLEGALNLESDKDTVSNGCFSVLYWRS